MQGRNRSWKLITWQIDRQTRTVGVMKRVGVFREHTWSNTHTMVIDLLSASKIRARIKNAKLCFCNSNLELVKNQRCRIRFHYGVIDYDHSIKINRSKTRAKTIHILSTQSCRSAQPQQRDTQDMFHKIRLAHLDIRTATSPLGNIRILNCD